MLPIATIVVLWFSTPLTPLLLSIACDTQKPVKDACLLAGLIELTNIMVRNIAIIPTTAMTKTNKVRQISSWLI